MFNKLENCYSHHIRCHAVEGLETLLEIDGVHDSVKRQARGALITLGIPLVSSQDNARSSPIGQGPVNEGTKSKAHKQIYTSRQ